MDKAKLNLQPKQELFALNVVKNGGDKVKARKDAGYSTAMSKASQGVDADKLYNHAKISKRIVEIKEIREAAIIKEIGASAASELLDLREEVKLLNQRLGENTRGRTPSKANRYLVMQSSGFKCQCCGASPSKHGDTTLHVDHITPYTCGGSNDPGNLQVLCMECNIAKSNMFNHNHNEGWR